MPTIVGVRFRKACRIYDYDANNLELVQGDQVIVEMGHGMSFGWIARVQANKEVTSSNRPLKKIIRKALPEDLDRLKFAKEREDEAAIICKREIQKYGIEMKLINVECLFDSSKTVFSFISENRVDFREIVKNIANELHTRIEMHQIGVRDEAKMIGGIGPCGMTLCCATHLVDFEPVSIRMAKEQNLSPNPAKLSGVCSRLMCCLAYEAAHNSSTHSSACGRVDNSNKNPTCTQNHKPQ